jgi:hypothetical protein
LLDAPVVNALPIQGANNQVRPAYRASGGKAFAALGAARVDNGATTAGRHACPEAMPASALQAAGLKSTLHVWNLIRFFILAGARCPRPTQEANSSLKLPRIQQLRCILNALAQTGRNRVTKLSTGR